MILTQGKTGCIQVVDERALSFPLPQLRPSPSSEADTSHPEGRQTWSQQNSC